jgi:RNA polymerase sigma-70 factor (ECF subfamily)
VCDSTSDECLMGRMIRGDQGAFETLYERYRSRLYGLAFRITGDIGGAEEVLQDTFFQLWRKGAEFDPARGPLVGWLVTMTRNRAISHARLKGKQAGGKSFSETFVFVRSGPNSPQLENMIVQQIISAALATLSRPARRVVVLAYFDGLTCEEIAVRTNSPLGTAKTRLRSAMKSLKAALTNSSLSVRAESRGEGEPGRPQK